MQHARTALPTQAYPWDTDSGKQKVTVYANMAVQKVQDVNLITGTMSVQVWLRLNWNDPR